MTEYLVYNDQTGDFVAVDDIVAVVSHEDGAVVHLQNVGVAVISPLKPRELLKRLTIIRYKRETNGTTQSRTTAAGGHSTL